MLRTSSVSESLVLRHRRSISWGREPTPPVGQKKNSSALTTNVNEPLKNFLQLMTPVKYRTTLSRLCKSFLRKRYQLLLHYVYHLHYWLLLAPYWHPINLAAEVHYNIRSMTVLQIVFLCRKVKSTARYYTWMHMRMSTCNAYSVLALNEKNSLRPDSMYLTIRQVDGSNLKKLMFGILPWNSSKTATLNGTQKIDTRKQAFCKSMVFEEKQTWFLIIHINP